MDVTPVLAAAAVALVLLLVAHRLRGEDGRGFYGIALAACAPFAAVLTAYILQGMTWNIPPTQFMDAALLSGAAAIPIGIVSGLGRTWRGQVLLGLCLFALGAAALFYFPTETLHERYWNGRVASYVGIMAAFATLSYAARLLASSRGRDTESLLATAMVALAASPALGWSGTGVSALNVAALSSSAGLLGLYLCLRPSFRIGVAPMGRAVAATQTALLAGLLANGVLYADTPRAAGMLLLTAPLLVLAPGKSLPASLVRLTLVAGVAAFAAYLSKGEPNPYG